MRNNLNLLIWLHIGVDFDSEAYLNFHARKAYNKFMNVVKLQSYSQWKQRKYNPTEWDYIFAAFTGSNSQRKNSKTTILFPKKTAKI